MLKFMLLLMQLVFANYFHERRMVFYSLFHEYRNERLLQNELNTAQLLIDFQPILNLKLPEKDHELFWNLNDLFEAFSSNYVNYYLEYGNFDNLMPEFIRHRELKDQPYLWLHDLKTVREEIENLSTFFREFQKSNDLPFHNFLDPKYWESIDFPLTYSEKAAVEFAKILTIQIRLFMELENYLMEEDELFRIMKHLDSPEIKQYILDI